MAKKANDDGHPKDAAQKPASSGTRSWGFFSIGGRRQKKKEKEAELERSIFIEMDAAGDGGDKILPDNAALVNDMTVTLNMLSEAKTLDGLIEILGDEMNKFNRQDIRMLISQVEGKLGGTNRSYVERLVAKLDEMYWGAFNDIAMLAQSRDSEEYRSPPVAAARDYWMMALKSCRNTASKTSPRLLYLKYLLVGFRMFVLGEPAHPVGTPFPGGHEVESESGIFYCPVREKADDVPYAVCPFCPAMQSTEFMLEFTKEEREKKVKQGYIQNYFTNFKG